MKQAGVSIHILLILLLRYDTLTIDTIRRQLRQLPRRRPHDYLQHCHYIHDITITLFRFTMSELRHWRQRRHTRFDKARYYIDVMIERWRGLRYC